MKTSEEIQKMLVFELRKNIDKVKSIKQKLDSYNEILGDTSFLLAGLLEAHLKKIFSEWDRKKWIDDSLIIKIEVKNYKVTIWGIMIWGIENTTEQWTDPFCFELELIKEKADFKKFTFLFGDMHQHAISYERFRNNRNYWDVSSRNWKYIINSETTN